MLNRVLLFLFLPTQFIFSQEKYNYDLLSRVTFGVHQTNFQNAVSVNSTPGYKGGLRDFPQYGLFLDYRIFDYKNSAIKAGVFLNSYRSGTYYSGAVYDPNNNDDIFVSQDPKPDDAYDKTRKIEVYLDYNYMIKIDDHLFLNLSAGYSYEFSKPIEFSETTSFSGLPGENQILLYRDIYAVNQTKSLIHFNPSISYKTMYGSINFGIRYSQLTNGFLSDGNYFFYDVDNNGQEVIHLGYFKQSGKYMGFTLSFTPSKNLFKKKK